MENKKVILVFAGTEIHNDNTKCFCYIDEETNKSCFFKKKLKGTYCIGNRIECEVNGSTYSKHNPLTGNADEKFIEKYSALSRANEEILNEISDRKKQVDKHFDKKVEDILKSVEGLGYRQRRFLAKYISDKIISG